MFQATEAGRHFPGGVPHSIVRQHLQEVLASDIFSRSERLSRFLRYIVEETLRGQAAILKEQVLACELYGRGTDFNAATDPAVRVDARRLRDKLREYYAEFPHEPVLIALPKGTYVPVFQWNPRVALPQPVTAGTEQLRPQSGKRRRTVLVAALIALAAATAWLTLQKTQVSPSTVAPLTSSAGDERWPALSPDGHFVAFTCEGSGNPESTDICVKAVGTEAIQRLMETPATESRPAWSPDGTEIAFARSAGGKDLGIFVVSRMGGTERKVSNTGSAVAWISDGKSILVRDRLHGESSPFGIFRIDLATSNRKILTQPVVGAGEWSLDVSPDGENLAFIRYQRPGVSDLYVMTLKSGALRRLTDWNTILDGPAWTPDGREVIYAVNGRLWRISRAVGNPGRGSPITDIPMQAGHVSISRPNGGTPARLVFHSPQIQTTLRKIDLTSAGKAGVFQTFTSFAPATRRDIAGPFSRDGSKVAFTSTRGSTDYELWVASSTGSHLRQLTHIGSNSLMLAHAWSPDGSQVLFEAAVDGNSDLYRISADSGSSVRLTKSPSIEALATWSADGRWIYYTKVTSGMSSDIWRIPAQGGPEERITRSGGSEPQESPDGKYIYHLDRPPLSGQSGRLMRTSASGGTSEVIHERIFPFYWSVADQGIHFLQEQGHLQSIHMYRFADQRIELTGTLPVRVAHFPRGPGRLTVSDDGRWALVSVTDRREGDLMVIDNFR